MLCMSHGNRTPMVLVPVALSPRGREADVRALQTLRRARSPAAAKSFFAALQLLLVPLNCSQRPETNLKAPSPKALELLLEP